MQTSGCGKPFVPGESVAEIETAGGSRSYRLHVPASYDPRRAVSVVLNFHGYAQTAEQQEGYSRLVPLSDAKGFVLVTPEGSGSPQGWAISGVYDDNGIDDVAFVADLVSHLSDSLCLDSRRIYATGHSNGAEMASQLACYLPGLIAAAAPVSGAVFQDCQGVGVPILAFQGTEDWNVPYDDSAEGVAQWVSHNGCPSDPVVSAPAEGVELRSWKCTGGDVGFYVIEGAGHVWPGGDQSLGGVGPATDAVNASEVMWEFFRTHPKR
jgi:polyhydroxybutyrate depolymerase